MSEQMEKYKNSLRNIQTPVLLSQCPDVKLDLRRLMKHAKATGIKVIELSENEKPHFIKNYKTAFRTVKRRGGAFVQ